MPLYEHIKLMLFPMILSNVIHMVLVKLNVLSFMNLPIWERAFGKNKTWRGVFIIVFLNGLFSVLISIIVPENDLSQLDFTRLQQVSFNQDPTSSKQILCGILGLFLGVMYLLFELPNSWVKRRLGIGAGELAKSTLQRWLFMFIDKSDSAVGVVLFYGWILQLEVNLQLELFAISVIIHISLAWLLYKLRIKSSL